MKVFVEQLLCVRAHHQSILRHRATAREIHGNNKLVTVIPLQALGSTMPDLCATRHQGASKEFIFIPPYHSKSSDLFYQTDLCLYVLPWSAIILYTYI